MEIGYALLALVAWEGLYLFVSNNFMAYVQTVCGQQLYGAGIIIIIIIIITQHSHLFEFTRRFKRGAVKDV